MEDYQLRVIEEHKSLEIKTKALFTFILSDKFKEVHPQEQGRLYVQHWLMCDYLDILGSRIQAFTT